MYNTYYNLTRSPFDITPDPSFLFSTKGNNEALAGLYYGVRRHKGIIVLTGEVGTGKTLLLRCLLQLLKKSQDVSCAYLFNSHLGADEFLGHVVTGFGLPSAGKNKSQLLHDLQNYVMSRGLSNLTTVLIVDEAHHLSTDTLEELRLLTNLETTEDKLLQILLVGQPELDQKLDSVELRQLKQRVSVRVSLSTLDAQETKGYIERRLHIAGANSHAESLFPEQTIVTIYRHSRGIPRLINTLCENALMTAYAKEMRSVTPTIIDDVARDFRLNVAPPRESHSKGPNEEDLRHAVRTLLDVYASLRTREEPSSPAQTAEIAI